MGNWKEEDLATPEFIEEYLQEFREGITNNSRYQLSEPEKLKVQDSLKATKKFCLELLSGKKGKLYMHDLILMAIGFYGGYLTALDSRPKETKIQNQN
jgi:hypothetical protein